jgi:hypothetical protein
MTYTNDGSDIQALESLEETMRVRAVEVAYQLLWNHPNWLRGYGFTVHESQWPEFLTSMGELRAEVQRIVEWETYMEQNLPRRPMPPDWFEVIAIAVHLLMTNQKPVRPLPLLVGRTFEAMARFYAQENVLMASEPVEECDGIDAGEWSGGDEMIEEPRTVH